MSASANFEESTSLAQPFMPAFGQKMLRHKLLLVAITLPVAVGLFAAAQLYPATYKSTAEVVVETRSIRTVSGLQTDSPFSDVTIGTEISILASREIFEKVADQLHLLSDPEFNKTLDHSPLMQWKTYTKDQVRRWLGIPEGKKVDPQTEWFDTVEQLRAVVKFAPVPLSRVIDISATSRDAKRSAAIVNGFAAEFIADHEKLSRQTSGEANEFLARRLTELQAAALNASSAVETYRIQHGLIVGGGNRGGTNTTLLQDRATTMSEQLIVAQQSLSRLQATQATLRSGRADLLTANLTSQTMAKLRELEAGVEGRRASLLSRYGASSGMLLPIDSELASIRQQIKLESARQSLSLEMDVASAQDNVRRLTADLSATRKQLEDMNVAQAHLDTLLTEATAAQGIYATFLQRSKETDTLGKYADTSVRVISRADTPVYPIFPQNKFVIPGSGAIALFLAGTIVLLIDRKPVLMQDALSKLFGVTALGSIPRRTSRNSDEFQTAIERLLSRVLYSCEPKAILITSPEPELGKTTIAQALAEAASARNLRVLLVNGDMRTNPERRGDMIGFSDVLGGRALPHETVQVNRTSDGTQLSLMPAGRDRSNPGRLMAGAKGVMAGIKADFDLVVVDGPPALDGGDCWLLSQHVDYTVLVIQPQTDQSQIYQAISELTNNDDPSRKSRVGIALNMVGTKMLAG